MLGAFSFCVYFSALNTAKGIKRHFLKVIFVFLHFVENALKY
jgi:hypothetical protein